jgi:hypothetical protein
MVATKLSAVSSNRTSLRAQRRDDRAHSTSGSSEQLRHCSLGACERRTGAASPCTALSNTVASRAPLAP